jgi:hypothetical protein
MYNVKEELNRMRANGLEIIKSFDKNRWDKKILETVEETFK